MKTFSLLVIFGGLNIASAFSQQDYLKMDIQDSVLECGNRDSAKTIRLIGRLVAINPATIDSNRHIYFKDLGMCYYNMFILKQDTSYLRLAIKQYDLSIEADSAYDQPYWNAAISLFILHECIKSKEYMNKYLALVTHKQRKKVKTTVKSINKCSS